MGAEAKGGEDSTGSERSEALFSYAPPIPSQEGLIQERGGEEDGRGREVG